MPKSQCTAWSKKNAEKLAGLAIRVGKAKETMPIADRTVTAMADDHSRHSRPSIRRIVASICLPATPSAPGLGEMFSFITFLTQVVPEHAADPVGVFEAEGTTGERVIE